jgi:ubiquinone/menaquinone biosynthesis C-methylase UbiE
MDQEHYLTQALLGTNHLAPIEDPDVILDVGTGTGTWVLVSE